MAVLLAPIVSQQLFECSDAGPWECTIEGCPAPEVTCSILAEHGFCTTSFRDIWEPPPPGTATAIIHDRCPRACGRCGVEAPDECNFEQLVADTLTEDALAAAIQRAAAPLIIRWREPSAVPRHFERLLGESGTLPVSVVVEGGRYRGEATEERAMTVADFPTALQNGSLPDDSYIFYELGGLDVVSNGRDIALAGVDVADESRWLLGAMPELRARFAQVLRRQLAAGDVDGRLLLSAGSWGNGRPFHVHGPALFTLERGVKRWFVRRPNASFTWQTYEVARGSLRESDALPTGWERHLWQCTQRVGELLWVPDQLPHATLNYAAETVGLTMVIDEVAPALTPLHEAAQSGSAVAVRTLLMRASTRVDAAAKANGATALHFAAGLGHCDAADALIEGGASLHARAKDGLTALHVAVASGHEDAVRLLLRRGASAELVDDNGHTPLGLAEMLGRDAVASILSEAARTEGGDLTR